MNISDYEDFVQNSAFYNHVHEGDAHEYSYVTLGMVGEAGEFADLVKKCLRQGTFESNLVDFQMSLLTELGDVLWYLTRMCQVLNLTLEDLATLNCEKLCNRHKLQFPPDPEELVEFVKAVGSMR